MLLLLLPLSSPWAVVEVVFNSDTGVALLSRSLFVAFRTLFFGLFQGRCFHTAPNWVKHTHTANGPKPTAKDDVDDDADDDDNAFTAAIHQWSKAASF